MSAATADVNVRQRFRGEVAEWLKAHAWKVCLRETVTRVRIPLSPPPSLSATLNRTFGHE
jgi:hypothetical protein